jgi:hypothetical protein
MLLLPVLLVLVACGGGDDPDVAATEDSVPATPLSATVDWADRTIRFDGDTRFDVNFCSGDAPLLCVSDDGTQLGVIELATFPTAAVDDFDAWADDFYSSVAADRQAACDASYSLDGDSPSPALVGGMSGVRYGFAGSVGDEEIERVVGYAVNAGDDLRLLVVNGLADDACLSRESEVPLGAMAEVEPLLEAIAEGSQF